MTVLAGNVVFPDRVDRGWVEVRDGRIADLQAGAAPAGAEVFRGGLIGPGFIDLHVHGGDGGDFMTGTLDAIDSVLAFHGAHGTTSLLATTVAESDDAISAALRGIQDWMTGQGSAAPRPEVLGAHLEGPYINRARSGGQNADEIRPPSIAEFTRWAALARVRMMTLSPETDEGLAVVREPAQQHPDVILSAGHTDATFAQLAEAAEHGVSHMTHFMSGMSPLHHRTPGAVGAGLMLDSLSLDVIPDLIHMDADVLRFVIETKHPRNVAIITDAVNFAGMADGDYSKRGREYQVSDGLVRLKSNGSLAGSTLTMERGVQNVAELGIDVAAAWAMGSGVPARLLGLADRKGRLEVGADADLVVLDDSWTVQRTIARGRTIYQKDDAR